ncbi:spore germination protein [Paenibacillus thalictri]|uniref:Spore germination protein n=2 Tax=Paenibacillus thalictri TaxID=2527873 RepID=A0A4Q9DWF4_9BACL|nr:spore germination protein [Paenibacillus thalictri]
MNEPEENKQPLSSKLAFNLSRIQEETGNSWDIKTREIEIFAESGVIFKGAIVYVEGLVNLHDMLHSLLSSDSSLRVPDVAHPEELLAHLRKSIIAEGAIASVDTFESLYEALFTGCSMMLLEGCAYALSVGTKDQKARPIEEPNVQSVVRGPREGFTEVISWNIAMVRRKIKSRHLRVEPYKIGKATQTDIALLYMDNIVTDGILDKLRERMSAIDVDGILESNYIEEYIQDKQPTPFPTVFNTERPDVVTAGMLEGRVAILVDGTPFALLVPALFTQFFQSSEDYYQRADFATLIRLLRFFSFFLALLTPSVYIAVSTFHQEMLPTTLLYNLASQREATPFPTFVEALLMEITFEILREASVRMPKTVGQSISIVGTLVIGQSAVEAGLVSAAMVIVVSITAISNFVLPAFNMGIAARIVRFLLMLLAATFGLYGIFIGMILIVLHLCSLTSIGFPYMGSLAPFKLKDQKDTFMRAPIPRMITRPKSFLLKNLVRQKKR